MSNTIRRCKSALVPPPNRRFLRRRSVEKAIAGEAEGDQPDKPMAAGRGLMKHTLYLKRTPSELSRWLYCIALLNLGASLYAAPQPDSFYFKKLPPLKVQHQGQTDDFNPHQVACTEVELCRQGKVEQALTRFHQPSNAEDPRVADAFYELLWQTAPRLQKYGHQPLYLLFLGMVDGTHVSFETLTVWYYALSDAQGHILKGSPLITVHRGKAFPECGLAEVGTDMVSRKPIQLPPELLRPR